MEALFFNQAKWECYCLNYFPLNVRATILHVNNFTLSQKISPFYYICIVSILLFFILSEITVSEKLVFQYIDVY